MNPLVFSHAELEVKQGTCEQPNPATLLVAVPRCPPEERGSHNPNTQLKTTRKLLNLVERACPQDFVKCSRQHAPKLREKIRAGQANFLPRQQPPIFMSVATTPAEQLSWEDGGHTRMFALAHEAQQRIGTYMQGAPRVPLRTGSTDWSYLRAPR